MKDKDEGKTGMRKKDRAKDRSLIETKQLYRFIGKEKVGTRTGCGQRKRTLNNYRQGKEKRI